MSITAANIPPILLNFDIVSAVFMAKEAKLIAIDPPYLSNWLLITLVIGPLKPLTNALNESILTTPAPNEKTPKATSIIIANTLFDIPLFFGTVRCPSGSINVTGIFLLYKY